MIALPAFFSMIRIELQIFVRECLPSYLDVDSVRNIFVIDEYLFGSGTVSIYLN